MVMPSAAMLSLITSFAWLAAPVANLLAVRLVLIEALAAKHKEEEQGLLAPQSSLARVPSKQNSAGVASLVHHLPISIDLAVQVVLVVAGMVDSWKDHSLAEVADTSPDLVDTWTDPEALEIVGLVRP